MPRHQVMPELAGLCSGVTLAAGQFAKLVNRVVFHHDLANGLGDQQRLAGDADLASLGFRWTGTFHEFESHVPP